MILLRKNGSCSSQARIGRPVAADGRRSASARPTGIAFYGLPDNVFDCNVREKCWKVVITKSYAGANKIKVVDPAR